MPTLLLMRHAKSDWGQPGRTDHDRKLNERGQRDAPRMGRWLIQQNLLPDWVITSSARRAKKTTKRVVKAFESDVYVEVLDNLYLASVETWLNVLAGLPAEAGCVLGVGHNPGLEHLVEALTGQSPRLSTAAIACIDIPGDDWSVLAQRPVMATLRALWRPKELPEETA